MLPSSLRNCKKRGGGRAFKIADSELPDEDGGGTTSEKYKWRLWKVKRPVAISARLAAEVEVLPESTVGPLPDEVFFVNKAAKSRPTT